MFHLNHACVRGGVVTLGGFILAYKSISEHANYPRGLHAEPLKEMLNKDYAPLIPWPLTTAHLSLQQRRCTNNIDVRFEPRFTDPDISCIWQRTPAFDSCLGSLSEKFRVFVEEAM